MKKTVTKCLCVLTVVAMLAAVFCMPASADEALIPDTRYYVDLSAGHYSKVPFTPSTSGRYIIESIGNYDTYVELYDASDNLIAKDDDDGTGLNFRLCTSLTAGRTYYYKIRFLSESASGRFEFDFYDIDTVTGNSSYSVTLIESASSWNKITPSKTSLYTFESTGSADTGVVLYDSQMNEIASDDDNGSDRNYKLSHKLSAGKTYYIQSYFTNGNAGELCFNVYDGLYRLTPGYSESGTIYAGEAVWASYVPDRTTCYTIVSYDSGDTLVNLYDANGKLIASNDDYGDGGEFMLSRRLTAGQTYYYEVRFYNSNISDSIYFEFYEEEYPDVAASTWFYDAVSYVSYFGFMTGYQNGNFGPADNLQRQDFVVTLARIAEADLTPYQYSNGGLSDVKVGSYYAPAVAWAVDNGIITGYQNGKFGVGDTITREQVCTILYRAFGSPAVSDAEYTLRTFPDHTRVSSFAKEGLAWAVQNNIISGMQNGNLAPADGASRAQIATILMRMDQNGMFGTTIIM